MITGIFLLGMRHRLASVVFVSLPGAKDTVEEYAALLNRDLGDYNVYVPSPSIFKEWQDWANYLKNSATLFQSLPNAEKESYPNPEDWRKWCLEMQRSLYI